MERVLATTDQTERVAASQWKTSMKGLTARDLLRRD
jgi:hypothetical protein